ncbi:hypothetical protein U1Q18_015396, partial [Sarracenia purpurea var. burkii]
MYMVRQHDHRHFQVKVAPPQPRHQQLHLWRARAALRQEELHHHPPLLCSSAVRSAVAFSKVWSFEEVKLPLPKQAKRRRGIGSCNIVSGLGGESCGAGSERWKGGAFFIVTGPDGSSLERIRRDGCRVHTGRFCRRGSGFGRRQPPPRR